MSDPAFPTPNEATDYQNVGCPGLSKRELFAAMAMAGLRAGKVHNGTEAYGTTIRLWSSQEVAGQAVKDADALLAELSK